MYCIGDRRAVGDRLEKVRNGRYDVVAQPSPESFARTPPQGLGVRVEPRVNAGRNIVKRQSQEARLDEGREIVVC